MNADMTRDDVIADLGVLVVAEAENALAEARSAARVDELRRDFDRAVEDHCMRFGFDPQTGHLL